MHQNAQNLAVKAVHSLHSWKTANSYNVDVGDLVYLYSDRDKSRARSRYLVVSIDGEWCFIKKFSGNQLHSSSYKVKREECYLVPNDYSSSSHSQMKTDYSTDDEDHDIQYINSSPPPAVDIPNVLTYPIEDIPVQANGPRNDEQYNYPIIIASPTEIATDNQPAINTHSIDHTEVQSPTRSRPRREIKCPKYLDDYVLQ